MKEVFTKDVKEFVNEELIPTYKSKSGFLRTIGVYCKYNIAKEITKELLNSGIPIVFVCLENPEYDYYEKEYYIDIGEDGFYVDKLWSDEHNRYLCDDVDVSYVHGDCSTKILDYISSPEHRLLFFDDIDLVDECYNVEEMHDDGMHGYTISGNDEKNGYWSKSFYSTKEMPLEDILRILCIK